MRKQVIIFFVLLVGVSQLHAQSGKPYQIYNKKGKQISFAEMAHRLEENYEVIFFGEKHNNAILHWLELQVVKAVYAKKGTDLILGAEMFERDNQKPINAYLAEDISLEQFKEKTRLWQNFTTDYQPLLDFAQKNNLAFVATNIPRRYAHIVAQNGLDTLNGLAQDDKVYIADLPIKVTLQTPGYQEMEQMMQEHAGDNTMNYIKAQATKDATMAESIYRNWEKGKLFFHLNGNFHTKGYGGIYWYLKKEKKFLQRLKIAVISIAESDQEQLPLPEDFEATEFTIVVPEDMTKTY